MRHVYLLAWPQLDAAPHRDGRLVLTPNRRAAKALGVPAESLESLARKLVREGPRGLAPRLRCHRLMIALAGSVYGASDAHGAARSVMPVVRTLLRAGVDLPKLMADGSPRVQRLAKLADAYRGELAGAGEIDPAESLREAAALPLERQAVLVAGYPRLGQDERIFLDAVAGPGSVLLLPHLDHAHFTDNLELARFLEARGWTVVRDQAGPAEAADCFRHAAPDCLAHEYDHQEAEVRGALAQIKALLLDGVPTDEIALVARNDAAYGPIALDVAWEFGVPLRALYAVPLADTRLGSWVRLLLEACLDGLPFEPTFRLLAHPLSPWFPIEKRNEARRKHPSGEDGWRQIDVDLAPLAWPEHDTRGAWRATFRRLMQLLGVRKQAARWPQDTLACRALLETLPVLMSPADEVITKEAFAEELLEAIALLTVPAQPGRGGVELHTPLSIFGARYRHVFVLGLAENVLPAPVANSPVLDFHERKQLAALGCQLEDAAAAARREFLSFASLLQTATETLTLSYPRLLGDKPALSSGYFKQLGQKPKPPGELPVCSRETARRIWISQGETTADAALVEIRRALDVERRRDSADPADEHDGVVGLPLDPGARKFSASQLTVIGQCPFKWFVRYALSIQEPEEMDAELQPNTRGTLYHRTLELALDAGRNEPDLRQAVLNRLEWALTKAEQELDVPELPVWEAQRQEHLRTLRRAIAGADFARESARVAGLEAEFEGEWHGLKVGGFVDRIDRTDDGLVLIDYKTSSKAPPGAQDAKGRATLDVQLPLYVQVAAPALFPADGVAGALYYSLTKGKVLKEAVVDDQALSEFAERVKARLREGDYPVRPDTGREACTYCDYELMCRRGPRLARKEAP